MSDWQDRIVGARMAVDDSYAPAIDDSQFSRQEWGLVMTAVEFDIDDPADDGQARLVADTSNLSEILPEVERVAEMQGGMAAAGQQESGGGFLDSVKGALGLDGGGGDDEVDENTVAAAESLVQGYAEELQAYLEEQGRWDEVRTAYRES